MKGLQAALENAPSALAARSVLEGFDIATRYAINQSINSHCLSLELIRVVNIPSMGNRHTLSAECSRRSTVKHQRNCISGAVIKESARTGYYISFSSRVPEETTRLVNKGRIDDAIWQLSKAHRCS